MQSYANDTIELDKRHIMGNMMCPLLLTVVCGFSYMNKLGLKYNQSKK